jgi:lysozyme
VVAAAATLAAAAAAAWSARGRFLGTDDQTPDALDRLQQLATDPAAMLTPTDSTDGLDPRDLRLRRTNRTAMLDAIAWAEGTDRAGGYRALYGSTAARPSLLQSFADHPGELGWSGVVLTDQQCAGAGRGPGCRSYAAGRYQITRSTWRSLGGRSAFGSFDPAAQDAAALRLIDKRGALADVDAGRFAVAVDKLRRTWASLPGAGYAGQPMRDFDALAATYAAAGGAFA